MARARREGTTRFTPRGRRGTAEIEDAFADGWLINAIDAVTIASALPSLPDGLRGWRATLTRTETTKEQS